MVNRMFQILYRSAIILLFSCSLCLAQDASLAPDGDSNNANWTSSSAASTCNSAACDDDLDESPQSTDNNVVYTSTDGSFIWFDFPTPASSPSTSTNAQTFDIATSECNGSTESLGSGIPTYDISLYCNGSSVSAIATGQSITALNENDTHPFTFNSGSCASDGSDVQVAISQTCNGGGPNARCICIESVEWEVTYASGRNRLL